MAKIEPTFFALCKYLLSQHTEPQHASVATHLTDENGKLPLWIKTTFAIPRFTIRASYIIQSAFLFYFYETIGAKLTYIAAYVAIARSFDVITDPFMGNLSDNTHSRFGRRKPYMAVGTVFYNVFFMLMLNPPRDMEHPAVSHWFGLTYTIFYLFDTFTSIPYYAFGMELTNDFEERDQVWFWNQLSGNLGTLVGVLLPGMLTVMGVSSLYDVYLITGLVFVAIHAGGMAANVILIAEKPLEEEADKLLPEASVDDVELVGANGGAVVPLQDPLENATAEPHPSPFVVNLLRCMRNDPFDKIIKSYFLDYLGLGMISAMLPFYVGYVLLRPDGGETSDTRDTVVTTGYIAVCVFIFAFLSVPVWESIARSTGKYKAWIYYSIWNAVTCPFFALCGTSVTWACVVAAFNGSAVGGQFLLDSIVNDVAEYDSMLHGDSIEGCFVAIQTFVPKIVLVAAMSMPFAIIVLAGFNPSVCTLGDDMDDHELAEYDDGHVPKSCTGDERAPEPQGKDVRWLIVAFFCIVPTVATLLSIYYKLQYPIKTAELAEKISDARAAHGRGEVTPDP
jgi:GPH family glycoside/pentoside/hexuronide:cation symporter